MQRERIDGLNGTNLNPIKYLEMKSRPFSLQPSMEWLSCLFYVSRPAVVSEEEKRAREMPLALVYWAC